MSFVHPSWISGLLFYALIILVPCLISVGIIFYGFIKDKDKVLIAGFILIVVSLAVTIPMSGVLWHYTYEVPSVQEKVVTVQDWQPKAGISVGDNGMMVIDNADQLMMVTTEKEGFLNEENLLFGKFDTRDILNTMKPNGTYKIKYYGWREGFNSGFPNILSVEEVIDESHAQNKYEGDYFGTKIIN